MRVPLRPRDICALVVVGAFALAASGTHVVRSGETLSSIAQRNGTTVRALVEANGITNPNLVLAGSTLKIPGGGGAGSASVATHTVRAGETLAGIASRYGTTVSTLAGANGISNPNLVVVGRSLQIQGSSGGSAAGPATGTTGGRQLPGQRHTVQPGDTIAGIAARSGVRVADLIAWNGLVDGKIYATTRLVLFDPGALPGGSGASGGGFVCPVPGATFFNDWGFPRSGGRAHAGTDMFAPRGTPVRAPSSGRVDIAEGRMGGKQFRLTTPAGVLYFGSHMNAFGASGQVRAGDVIGYVGDSGNARGSRPHLHFEVHPTGSAANPFPLLRSSC